MFERFTDRARRVVVLAQEEARLLNHSYIGTEHILLGLIAEAEGVAAKVLEGLGISAAAVREKVESIIGEGGSPPSGHIPFTPRAKKVLELSLREALQLGHNYIGTEHILLGLVREGEGVAAQVLVTMGADLSAVRQSVVQELSGYSSRGRARPQLSALERRETPAMVKAGALARHLARSGAVGSHHLLLALLSDEESLAAKALAGLGVTKDAVEEKLEGLDRAGTSDETPEEAGARRIGMRVEGKLLMLEIDDPELAESVEKAMAGRKVRIIKGTDPEAEAAGFPHLWSAVSRTVDDLTRRLGRVTLRGTPTEWRPPGWHQGGHAAAYWIVHTSGGRSGTLQVSDAEPAAVRAWLREWFSANGPGLGAKGDVSVFWAYVDRAGDSFTMTSFGFGADGPAGAERVPVGTLVGDALADLAA